MLNKPPFPTRNNSYRNVILAFGGDDDAAAAAATPPLPSSSTQSSTSSGDVHDLGCSNPVTSGPLAESECWWDAGAWPPKARRPSASVGGTLMPIDERLEDLYAAAKQQQRWRDSQQSMATTRGAYTSNIGGDTVTQLFGQQFP